MKSLAITALALLAGLPLSNALASGSHPLDASSKSAVKVLGGTLLNKVKSAMKAGGPVNAINTCNTKAMPLTQQISQQQGLEISRTALKVRNLENQPDSWEVTVLEQFIARQSQGEPLQGMSYSEVVEHNGQKVYRMMQAIPTQKACLTCHGAKIAPEVTAKLDSLYPQDKARGFAEGDLRGAFSVSKVL